MRLTCNKCRHQWDDEPDATQAVVQCPECFAIVPLVLAKQGGSATAPPASPAKTDVHDQKTLVESPPTVIEPRRPSPPPAQPQPAALETDPYGQTMVPSAPPTKAATPAQDTDPFGKTTLEARPPRPAAAETDPYGQTMAPSAPPTRAASPAQDTDPFGKTTVDARPARPAATDTDPFGKTTLDARPAQSAADTDPFGKTVLDTNAPTVGPAPTRPRDSVFEAPAPSGAAAGAAPRPAPTGPKTKRFSEAMPKEIDLTGQTVGGYEIKKMLGAGGMGAVCLARQISLDRDVALKILPGGLAANPEFLARFTREALSAAQLTHHNVIQVYDVGSDKDIHYISMEFVRGDNLGNIVRRDGRLTPDDAAGFVLQAARGLRYAHERGIIHRDIKPDNIMVNDQGIVKIADMGLAKMRTTRGEDDEAIPAAGGDRRNILERARGDITLANAAMGTPAYMAPEQARDAGKVDHRADIYSLGCTLYYLIAGKPPFSGSTAFEIISKHEREPLPPLEAEVGKLPPAYSAIVRKMTAKRPEDRYSSLDEVIQDLEAALGIEGEKGAYSPREHHARILEQAQAEYYSVPGVKVRRLVKMGFMGGMAVLLVVAVLAGWFKFAGGILGLMVLTPVFNFIADGILTKNYLFRRVRSVFFGMTPKGWATVIAGTVIGAAMLWALGLLVPWLAVSVLAAGLAAAYQLQVRRPLAAQRAASLGQMQEMLKQLRVRGVSEEAIQNFVARFSGDDWEEFFEELFGYEAMVTARGKWASADRVKPRRRHGTWREPLVRWLEQIEEARKAERERRQLAKVEAQRLKAQGVSEKEAEEQAALAATKIYQDIQTQTATLEDRVKQENKRRARQMGGMSLGPINGLYRLVRFAAGAFGCLVFVLYGFGAVIERLIPGVAANIMALISQLPIPAPVAEGMRDYRGAAACGLLLLSAFSGRLVGPTLTVLGTVAAVGGKWISGLLPLPAIVSDNLLLGGLAAAGAGLVLCVLGKVLGGRF